MTVLQESDKVKIRKWMASSYLYQQLFPKLENAMNAISAKADGGNQPDDSAVLLILTALSNLDSLEAGRLQNVQIGFVSKSSSGTMINPLLGYALNKKEISIWVGYISDILSTRPYRNVGDPAETQTDGGYSDTRWTDKQGR